MQITVKVTAKMESDSVASTPVAEQTYFQVEIEPTRWVTTVLNLGEAALADVSRMIEAVVVPVDQASV